MPVCEETFPTTVPLYNHFKQSHSVDGMLLCTLCDKKFPATCKYSFRNFRHHLRRMHRDIGQFPCDICGKVFKQKHGMQKHREFVHKATRDMVCECGKSFFSRRHLLNHKERVHAEGKVDLRKNPGAGEKKQAVTKDYVPPQKTKHYTEFPYQCEECQQGFVRRGMFAYHLTVRHPERSLDAEPQLALSSTVVQDSLH
ncbi:PR domain zinc finger protein 10-like isoform X2 [Paramacrobiotus metropolitanus]|uniref:PR domain zinc finger protein 10-like isoform X2 n=1 Tax=Paramacrobiotus metropolitanus TaxID=2943436 RepID=UPI00244594EC|nr:PR domain zinc finger protein 10-like isoform X2 [Paramacrobiotus metropolitanus]